MSDLTTNNNNDNLFLESQKSLQESQMSLFKILRKKDQEDKVRDQQLNVAKVEREKMAESLKYLHDDNRARKVNEGRVTANFVAKILGLKSDTSVTRPLGMELRNISLKLRIPIKQTDADTNAVYSTVNTYHPYVAKIYIEQNGYPVPPQFQYISKP